MHINLPSVWVYRSPQRKKYCRGPILAYWPRKLSAHEFVLKRKNKNKLNTDSMNRACLHLSDFLTIYRVKFVSQNKQRSYFSRWKKSFAGPFCFLSKSAPVSSGLSTRRHVGKFLQSPIANITDAPRPSGYRWVFPPTKSYRILPTLYQISPQGNGSILTRDKWGDERWRWDLVRGE